MPGFDRKGPLSRGPMTGRGFGPCGRGLRRGYGRFSYQRTMTKEEEKQMLKEEKELLQEDLKEIEKRLVELK